MSRHGVILVVAIALVGLGLVAYSTLDQEPTETERIAALIADSSNKAVALERSPEVPDLPFDDNPDPNQCGIPVQWGSNGQAWLTGIWEGELIQPEVYLYDSHLRLDVTGKTPHGTEVQILLFQENPALDYYFVKIEGDTPLEGWVPAEFLSFDPVT